MTTTDRRLHQRTLEFAATELDFSLAPGETAALAAHLAACPACARTATRLRLDASALRRPAELAASYRLDTAVGAAIAGHSARRAASRTLILVVATALLLAAILGAAAVGAFLLRPVRPPLIVNPSPPLPAVVTDASPGPSSAPSSSPVPVPALVVTAGMSADEVVAASQAAHRQPPPFTLTTTFGPPQTYRTSWYTACGDLSLAEDRAQIQWRYSFDGTSFRQECRYGAGYVGGFEVLGPEGHGTWDAAAWKVVSGGFLGRPDGAPLATPLWLNWVNVGAADDPAAGRQVTCGAWKLGPLEQVAARPAQVVSCGTDRYWIDRGSGLLVKRERDGMVLTEARSLQVGATIDPALFAMLDPGFTTELIPGRRPVEIQLPRLSGGTWSSESLVGRRLAAILIQSDCHAAGECLPLDAFVAAVTERADRMGAAAIALYGAFSGPSVAAAEAAGVPVLVDDQTGWPVWATRLGVALFGADGRLVAVVDPRTPASLAAVLDAFLDGREIPVPPPWDGTFIVGEAVPPLRGLPFREGTLSMDPFDLASFRGRPVAILAASQLPVSGLGASCDTWAAAISAAVAPMAAARQAFGDGAGFVVASRDSPTQQAAEGWARILAAAGTNDGDISVVVPGESTAQPWSWSSLRSRQQDPCGVEAALVIVGPDGTVRGVFGDALPTADALEAILRGLLP